MGVPDGDYSQCAVRLLTEIVEAQRFCDDAGIDVLLRTQRLAVHRLGTLAALARVDMTPRKGLAAGAVQVHMAPYQDRHQMARSSQS